MKKTLLTAALIAGFGIAALAPLAAQAASSGVINFSGKVFADTCTITVNGGSTVTLPPVMVSAFGGAANTVAGATNFSVALTGCDTNISTAQMAFSGSQVDTTTGNLKNTGSSNVEIELLNGASVVNTNTQANAPKISLTNGAGTAPLTAQYISTTAATTAGLVSSTVNFTLTYN